MIRNLKDPTGTAEWQRFEQTVALFRKYGEQYGFDPLMLAAQATRSRSSTRTPRATSARSA